MTLHRIGHARTSRAGQTLFFQIGALQKTGGGKILSDKMAGLQMYLPGWAWFLGYARPDDMLAVIELSPV